MSRMSAVATLTARQSVNVALRRQKNGKLVFLFAGDQSPKALCIWEKLEVLAQEKNLANPGSMLTFRTLPINRIINSPESDEEDDDSEEEDGEGKELDDKEEEEEEEEKEEKAEKEAEEAEEKKTTKNQKRRKIRSGSPTM